MPWVSNSIISDQYYSTEIKKVSSTLSSTPLAPNKGIEYCKSMLSSTILQMHDFLTITNIN